MTTTKSATSEEKPAWYSIPGHGQISDFVNLLHPPYTVWHLSYVLIGIAISPVIFLDRSIAVLLAFFFGLGIGAHALDETMGNPLQTRLSKKRLYIIGLTSISVAVGIGLYYVVTVSLLILPIVLAEVFFALAYNLEMFGKKFHTMIVFAISWGVLPFLTGYFVNSLSISPTAVVVAVAIALLTYVQRTLSFQARSIRGNNFSPQQSLRLTSGEEVTVTSRELILPAERSLKALSIMIFLFAIALIFQRII